MQVHKTVVILVAALAMSAVAGCARDCLVLERCGDQCVELTSDHANCGACGTVCSASEMCFASACRQRMTIGSATSKLDLLFMHDNADNGNGTDHLTVELTQRFDQLVTILGVAAKHGLAADLHLGVVTSDYGAGKTGGNGCQPSPGGERGVLQAIGTGASVDCRPLMDGLPFAHVNFDPAKAGENNLPIAQSLTKTLECMSLSGSGGCNFQHSLESVYAALHNSLPENAGFLRDDAKLAVVFLTSEDDSSAPPDTDMFDKTQTAKYGYPSSYRSTHFGIECEHDGALALPPYGDSGGPLLGCVPATNPPGEEYDVHRYSDFFTRPSSAGGVKADPADVSLFAIDAPGPQEGGVVQVVLSDPELLGTTLTACSPLDEAANPPCVPMLQHSCQNADSPYLVGDPAVRLNAVVHAARGGSFIGSICDSDYSASLVAIGNQLVATLASGCLSGPLTTPADPDCRVEQVNDNGNAMDIPRCDATASNTPCWSVTADARCAVVSPAALRLSVNRGAVPPTPASVMTAACATSN